MNKRFYQENLICETNRINVLAFEKTPVIFIKNFSPKSEWVMNQEQIDT